MSTKPLLSMHEYQQFLVATWPGAGLVNDLSYTKVPFEGPVSLVRLFQRPETYDGNIYPRGSIDSRYLWFGLIQENHLFAWFETQWLVGRDGTRTDLDIWGFQGSSYLLRMPRRTARGLVASALCEILAQDRVPPLIPAMNASGYPWLDQSDRMFELDRCIAKEGKAVREEQTEVEHYEPEEDRDEVLASIRREACEEVSGLIQNFFEIERRVKTRVASNAQLKERWFHIDIYMQRNHGDYGGPSRAIPWARYDLRGGIDRTTWSVRSVIDTYNFNLDEELASEARSPTQALKEAGLLVVEHEGEAAWLGEALNDASEASWAPGLRDAVAPGRLLGSDPLMFTNEDFLAWVHAAGLTPLFTDAPPHFFVTSKTPGLR